MGASKVDVVKLTQQAGKLKDALKKSKAMSNEMISILTSFDTRLKELEIAMRPIQVKTHKFLRAYTNISAALQAAEKVLRQFSIPKQVEIKLRDSARRDVDSYLVAMVLLDEAIKYFQAHKDFKDSNSVLLHATDLRKYGLEKLHTELQKELSLYEKPLSPVTLSEALPSKASASAASPGGGPFGSDGEEAEEVEEEERPVKPLEPLMSPTSVRFLHSICERTIAMGDAGFCTRIYRDSRSKFISSTLSRLGVEELDGEDLARMDWDVLEGKIGNWMSHMRIMFGVLFVEERKLCDAVFKGLDPHRERVFAELADKGITLLMNFGGEVAESEKSPEKLFVLLDMYEAVEELIPQMEKTFAGQACIPARESGRTLLRQLAQAAKGTFVEFEKAVESDTHRSVLLDGSVHPLTSYVINYVKFLFDYESTLANIFDSQSSYREQPDGSVDKTDCRLAQATQKIFVVLVNNLEAKAKAYHKDQALVHVFLMNNVHYMVRSTMRSEVAIELLGKLWIERHRRIVQQHAAAYQRLSWGKVFGYFTSQGLLSESNLSKNAVKDRFKNFNASFDELIERQSKWMIPDTSLRDAVLLSISEVLLPAYHAFVQKYRPVLENHSKNVEKYIKYSVTEIEVLLQDMFTGKTMSAPR